MGCATGDDHVLRGGVALKIGYVKATGSNTDRLELSAAVVGSYGNIWPDQFSYHVYRI